MRSTSIRREIRDGGKGLRSAAARWVLVALLVLGGCAARPPLEALTLEPGPDSRIWPSPPEIPRIAYVRSLVGERDFVNTQQTRNTFISVLAWVAGVILGEPDYLELRRPVAGITDESGRILVADMAHQAVIVFDMAAGRVLKWSRATPQISFRAPVALLDDGAGGIYVTDSALGEVFRLDREGNPVARFGADVLARPTGIARDPVSGVIYVADTGTHDVKLFRADGAYIDTLGGRGIGWGEFNFPTFLAFRNQNLVVSDSLNFRVQVLGSNGEGRVVFGQLGLFVGNMTRPKGVAVGDDGRIYVVESYFDHLLIFDKEGNFLLPIGGTGRGIGEFYLPSGVWTDASRHVYVADMFNGRISVFKELTQD